MAGFNSPPEIAGLPTFGSSPISFAEEKTKAVTARTPISYWLLLIFLFLVYANLPMVMPALDVLHMAKVVAIGGLVMLLAETVMGRRSLEFVWPEGGFLLAFLGAAALSCITALWPAYAVEACVDLAKMGVVYFFIVNCANTERRVRGVIWVMLIGGLLPAAGALKNYLQGNLEDGRAGWVGIFANPNDLAYSLVILVPLILFLMTGLKLIPKVALLGILAIYLAGVFVTFSRGGVVGLMAVIALCAWRKRSIWLQLLIALCVAGGLFLAARYWTRDEAFSGLKEDVTFGHRLATSKAGLAMFADHPLTGVGVRCSVIGWRMYAPPGVSSRGALVTHNTIIQALAETGILGFIPFVLLIGFGIYYARKLALKSPGTGLSNLGAGLEIALWGFVICGMAGGYLLSWFPYILIGLVSASRLIARNSQ